MSKIDQCFGCKERERRRGSAFCEMCKPTVAGDPARIPSGVVLAKCMDCGESDQWTLSCQWEGDYNEPLWRGQTPKCGFCLGSLVRTTRYRTELEHCQNEVGTPS